MMQWIITFREHQARKTFVCSVGTANFLEEHKHGGRVLLFFLFEEP
jgi:hypothetical protein